MALDVQPRLTWRRLFWLAGLIAFFGAITASEPVHAPVRAVVAWAHEVIVRAPTAGMVVFVALTALSAMFAFLSSSVLAPVAIAAWGKSVTFLLLWVGWLLGGALTYAVGRYLGRGIAGALAGAETVTAAETFVRDRAHVLHVLVFQLAMPSEVLGYVLGILRYRFAFYMAVLAVSEVPFAVAVVYLGESFLEGRAMTFVGIGLAMLAMSVGLYSLMTRLAQRPSER